MRAVAVLPSIKPGGCSVWERQERTALYSSREFPTLLTGHPVAKFVQLGEPTKSRSAVSSVASMYPPDGGSERPGSLPLGYFPRSKLPRNRASHRCQSANGMTTMTQRYGEVVCFSGRTLSLQVAARRGEGWQWQVGLDRQRHWWGQVRERTRIPCHGGRR